MFLLSWFSLSSSFLNCLQWKLTDSERMFEISLGQTGIVCGKAKWILVTQKGCKRAERTQDESNKYLQFLEGVLLCLLVLWNHVVVGRMTARENPEHTQKKKSLQLQRHVENKGFDLCPLLYTEDTLYLS